MTDRPYRIELRGTGQVTTEVAESAQQACEKAGWMIGDCDVRPLRERIVHRPIPGSPRRPDINTPAYWNMTHERYFRVGAYATIKAERERGPWDEVLRVTPERGRFLDVGCSAGLLLRLLEEGRPHLALTGLDYSKSGVFMASLLARSAHVVVGDAERLPFPGGAFDVVYSGHLIEHLLDPLRTLREQWRVLARGGRVIVQFPHADLHYVEHVHDNILVGDVVRWLKLVGFGRVRAGRIIRGPPVDEALVWARK